MIVTRPEINPELFNPYWKLQGSGAAPGGGGGGLLGGGGGGGGGGGFSQPAQMPQGSSSGGLLNTAVDVLKSKAGQEALKYVKGLFGTSPAIPIISETFGSPIVAGSGQALMETAYGLLSAVPEAVPAGGGQTITGAYTAKGLEAASAKAAAEWAAAYGTGAVSQAALASELAALSNWGAYSAGSLYAAPAASAAATTIGPTLAAEAALTTAGAGAGAGAAAGAGAGAAATGAGVAGMAGEFAVPVAGGIMDATGLITGIGAGGGSGAGLGSAVGAGAMYAGAAGIGYLAGMAIGKALGLERKPSQASAIYNPDSGYTMNFDSPYGYKSPSGKWNTTNWSYEDPLRVTNELGKTIWDAAKAEWKPGAPKTIPVTAAEGKFGWPANQFATSYASWLKQKLQPYTNAKL